MDPFIKLDIFFFISSVFVVVLTVFVGIAAFYIIKILKNFADISDTLTRAAHTAGEQLEEITAEVTESPIFKFLFGRKKRKARKDITQ